jgi:biopolymer transport protein ExbD
MNFRRGQRREDPEINFIPLIDLLLVILIFLMVTTTFAKFSELQLSLPSSAAQAPAERPPEIAVTVSSDARYAIDGAPAAFRDANGFARLLERAASGRADATLVIYADAGASHQSVVNVLEAARLAALERVSFATQAPQGSAGGSGGPGAAASPGAARAPAPPRRP